MKLSHRPPTPTRWLPGALLLATVLSGCAETSAIERALGDSVREARARQAVAAPPNLAQEPAFATDGVIAVHGVDRYQRSWISPPPPVNVLNIQAGGATAPAATAMPR